VRWKDIPGVPDRDPHECVRDALTNLSDDQWRVVADALARALRDLSAADKRSPAWWVLATVLDGTRPQLDEWKRAAGSRPVAGVRG
jgi:hypothetical protein